QGSRPLRTDNALVTAAEVVRRVAAYHPRARILDEWRRFIEGMELGPDLTEALTDPDRVYDTAATMEPLALARTAHACTHTTFSPNVVRGGGKINVIPDRVQVDAHAPPLPGMTPHQADAPLVAPL